MAHLSLSFFGSPRVMLGDALVESFRYDKVFALLAYLATEADRPHRRERLAGLLWPDQPERAARRSLSQALYALRVIVDEERAEQPRLLVVGEGLRLNPNADWSLDVATVTAALDTPAAHRHPPGDLCPDCVQQLAAGLRPYAGPFLAGFSLPDSALFDEWVAQTREQLHRRVMEALDALAAWHADTDPAPFLRRQLELEPWHEPAHRRLMAALAAQGDRASALAQYERCRASLAAEFSVEPEQATLDLYEAIRSGSAPQSRRSSAAVHQPTAPLAALSGDHPSLPVPLTDLIGRARELAEVSHQLTLTRLLTLTGAGGSGKTRLAIAVATALRQDFADGVFFVNLAPIADPSLVLPSVASTLTIREQDGRPLFKTVLDHLRDRQVLLVLDNFEHVLTAAAQLVDWLRVCARLTVLVTSRTMLRVSGEQEYPVRPLGVPDTHAAELEADDVQYAERIGAFPAVALFVERTRAATPHFTLTTENAPLVAEICRRLDGLPLAIELAAARTKVLSVSQLAARLDRAYQLLNRGQQDALPRHQTLRAAVDWSYELLAPPEQTLLQRLSVFAGTFSLQAVEGICTDGELAAEEILDLLANLVDQSLVMTQVDSEQARYQLLETIRQYASEKLRATGADTISTQHAAFFTALAGAAEPWLMTPERETWLARLGAEHNNIRAALGWLLIHQPERSLNLASALLWFWWFSGLWSEVRAWIERALVQAAGAAARDARGKGLFGAGLLAWFQNDFVGARPHLEESEAIWRTLGAEHSLAQAMIYGGGALYGQGAFADARVKLEEALKIALRLGEPWLIAVAQMSLGDVVTAQGKPAHGRTLLEASLGLWRQIGDERLMAFALMYLGQANHALGDYALAQEQLTESITIHRRVGQRSGAAIALLGLTDVALSEGAHEQARTNCREAFLEFYALDAKQGMAETLERMGKLLAVTGQDLYAARLLGAADALRTAIGAPITPLRQTAHEQTIASVRATAGEGPYLAAWNAGQAMNLAQVRADVLGEVLFRAHGEDVRS